MEGEEEPCWLDYMGEAEPEFHRSLNTILAHPMESEQNRWAVGLLTFTRETSGEGGAGGEGVSGGGCVELEPGGGDVAVTDTNKVGPGRHSSQVSRVPQMAVNASRI